MDRRPSLPEMNPVPRALLSSSMPDVAAPIGPNPFSWRLLLTYIVLVTALAGFFTLFRSPDRATTEDLYKLETAINHYYDTTTTSKGEHRLPDSLRVLHVKHLAGTLADYQFTFSHPTSLGGSSIAYELCATFHSTGDNPADQTDAVADTAKAYGAHGKGLQCFHVGYYRSSSSVSAGYTPKALIKVQGWQHPQHHPDFSKLLTTTQEYYNAQTKALGIVGSDQDLVKVCTGQYLGDEYLNNNKATEYNCTITAHKLVAVTAAVATVQDQFARFAHLAASQGFKSSPQDSLNHNTGSSALPYSQEYHADQKTCQLSLKYASDTGPFGTNGQRAIVYELTCSVVASAVPAGYSEEASGGPYVVCGAASYEVYPVGYGLVTAISAAPQTITVQYPDVIPGTANKPTTVAATPLTKTFTLTADTEIFDSRCHPTTFQAIQVGTRVGLYQNGNQPALVTGIYIGQQGMAQPSRPL